MKTQGGGTPITDEELALFEAVQTIEEWGRVCDTVRKSRKGRYPSDFHARVHESGLAARVAKRWQK